MVRFLCVLVLTSSTFLAFADGPTDDLKKKPITTDTSDIGKLLRDWAKMGAAAGNVGGWYDNRDRERSPPDLLSHPRRALPIRSCPPFGILLQWKRTPPPP